MGRPAEHDLLVALRRQLVSLVRLHPYERHPTGVMRGVVVSQRPAVHSLILAVTFGFGPAGSGKAAAYS